MNNRIEELKARLAEKKYICDDVLASAIYVALKLNRPLLIEGAAGVGKTEVAKAMSKVLDRELVRLQCHYGIDETRAVYEWNYQKQLLAIQAYTSSKCDDGTEIMQSIFSWDFLLERPLLYSIKSEDPVVLLIDELDKTDEEFEAFLLELLAEYQVTIPELGTFQAQSMPFTVLTSNNTRPLSDALRRRCIYAYVDYPTVEREMEIIKVRFPDADELLSEEVALTVAHLRSNLRILKKPSISETLDWISALEAMEAQRLDRVSMEATISSLLKNHDDIEEALQDPELLPEDRVKVAERSEV